MLGWEARCEHAESPPVPALILDPFSGTGTTVTTALQLGRRALGVDINAQYADMAEERIREGLTEKGLERARGIAERQEAHNESAEERLWRPAGVDMPEEFGEAITGGD